jgi:protein-disulfide isomerase
VPVLEQVLEKYPEDVKLVFKNYPLRNHRFARQAAAAALAADKQGKFWEFHDLLFKNYNRLNQQEIQEIAKKLALDMVRFQEDRQDSKTLAKIQGDISEGNKAGVRGTPTIFINGRMLRNRSLEGFSALIAKELDKVGKRSVAK